MQLTLMQLGMQLMVMSSLARVSNTCPSQRSTPSGTDITLLFAVVSKMGLCILYVVCHVPSVLLCAILIPVLHKYAAHMVHRVLANN